MARERKSEPRKTRNVPSDQNQRLHARRENPGRPRASHARRSPKGASAKNSSRNNTRFESSSNFSPSVEVKAHGGSARHASVNIRSGNPRRRGSVIDKLEFSSDSSQPDTQSQTKASTKTLAEKRRKRSRGRKLVIGLCIFLVVAAIAIGVGIFAYLHSTNSNLSLRSSNATEALVAVEDEKPYYVLCVADLENKLMLNNPQDSIGYLVVKIDAKARLVDIITLPSKIAVRMSDGANHPIDEAVSIGGDKELIEAASTIIGAPINHFIYTNSQGIEGIVDDLGGVEVDVTEEIDDPYAGTSVIPFGLQDLTGKQSVVYLKASNFKGGYSITADNRMNFTIDLADEVLGSNVLDFAGFISDISSHIMTDMDVTTLMSIAESLRPIDNLEIHVTMVPYYESKSGEDGSVVYQILDDSWAEMLERLSVGQDPNIVDLSAEGINPKDVTVEIRNGANATGAAGKLGEKLSGLGYRVEKVGNTDDSTIYPETFVIYTDPSKEGSAKAVMRDMGGGRLINGGDFYTSSADVIAIIGLDWMPVE